MVFLVPKLVLALHVQALYQTALDARTGHFVTNAPKVTQLEITHHVKKFNNLSLLTTQETIKIQPIIIMVITTQLHNQMFHLGRFYSPFVQEVKFFVYCSMWLITCHSYCTLFKDQKRKCHCWCILKKSYRPSKLATLINSSSNIVRKS